MTAASGMAVLHFLLVRPLGAASVSANVATMAFALAVLCTVLPLFLLNAAMKTLSAQSSSVIGMLSPLALVAMAYWFLGESLSILDSIGALLVIVGVGLSSWVESR